MYLSHYIYVHIFITSRFFSYLSHSYMSFSLSLFIYTPPIDSTSSDQESLQSSCPARNAPSEIILRLPPLIRYVFVVVVVVVAVVQLLLLYCTISLYQNITSYCLYLLIYITLFITNIYYNLLYDNNRHQ